MEIQVATQFAIWGQKKVNKNWSGFVLYLDKSDDVLTWQTFTRFKTRVGLQNYFRNTITFSKLCSKWFLLVISESQVVHLNWNIP